MHLVRTKSPVWVRFVPFRYCENDRYELRPGDAMKEPYCAIELPEIFFAMIMSNAPCYTQHSWLGVFCTISLP